MDLSSPIVITAMLLQHTVLAIFIIMTTIYGFMAPWYDSKTGKIFFGFLATWSIFFSFQFLVIIFGIFPGIFYILTVVFFFCGVSTVTLMSWMIKLQLDGTKEARARKKALKKQAKLVKKKQKKDVI